MSDSISLMTRDNFTVAFIKDAEELKARTLETSALIGKVETEAENAQAVEAQSALHALLSQVEKSRVAIKEPVLQLGKRIDQTARDFRAEVEQELTRITRLIGDYLALEEQRRRAAEALKNNELADIERQRQHALAQASSHEETDQINEHYTGKLAAVALVPAPAPARAEGQTVKHDWDVTVTDIYLLVRAHPTCVKIEPRLGEIKNLLNAGVKVAGVSATRIVKAGLRVKKQSKAIEV